jgi:hypothetical protein
MTMASIEIRELHEADFGKLLEMYARFEPLGAAQGLPPISEEARRDWLLRLLRETDNFGAFAAKLPFSCTSTIGSGGLAPAWWSRP